MPRDRTNFLLSPAEHAASVEAALSQLDAHSWWKRAEMQVHAAGVTFVRSDPGKHSGASCPRRDKLHGERLRDEEGG